MMEVVVFFALLVVLGLLVTRYGDGRGDHLRS